VSKSSLFALVSVIAALALAAALAHAAGDKPAPAQPVPAKPTTEKPVAEKPAAKPTTEKSAEAPAKPDALEPFRKLAGTWVGQEAGHDGGDVEMTYRVIAAGSAVVEEMFRGTPHEMITVYHLDGDQLVLTHYCAARNQPHMKAAKSDDPQVVRFEFAGGTNVDPARSDHMHSVIFRFISDTEVESVWTHWKDGKAASDVKFSLKRKAS
jgi:hypothetical protein